MKPKSILRFSVIAAASFAASANAATYNWIGTTSDFNEPTNWVENVWAQWGDYRFGSAAVSGAVNLDAFFGGGNWYLDSGLAHDVTLTGSEPLVAYANSGNGGLITIDTASRDLTIQTGLISAGAATWNVGAGRTLTMEGQLNDWFNTASLVKQGSGAAILKSANGYTGGTTLSGGILRLENISALGGGGLSMAGGTTLQLSSDVDATFAGGNGLGGLGNASITIDVNQLTSGNSNKTLAFAPGGFNTFNTTINATGGNGYLLALGGINNGYNGALNLNADTTGLSLGYIGTSSPASSLTVGGASNTTVTGAVNTGSLTKNGAGTLTLSGTINNPGATTVSGGILSLSSASLDDGAPVAISSGAILNLNFPGNDTVGSLDIGGSGPLPAGTYNSSTHPLYFTGTGALVVLAQDGTWASLVDGNWSDPANWAGNILASGTDNTATFNAATGVTVTLDSNRTIGNLAFDVSDYILAGSNTLTLDSSGTPGIDVTTGRTATISANLGGTLGMEKTGAGTLVLSAANTFNGETLVTNGLLQLGASSASNPQFGVLENSSLLTINTGATVRAMGANAFKGWSGGNMDVTLNGGALTLNDGVTEGGNHNLGFVALNGGTISGVGNPTFGGFNLNSSVDVTENSTISATNTNTNGGTRTITVSAGKTLAWSGTISNGYLNAASSFIFEGTGTTVLSGLNTYTGNTTINEGTLELADNAQLKFAVTDAPDANIVTGAGTATFNGDFNIDTSGVAGTTGYIWLLVDRANLTGESFDDATFSVLGFLDPENDGVWTMSDTKGDWSFSEATGELTLVVSSDYDDWELANGVTGGETDDDDADGLTNFEEYAFGLDPTGGSSANPIAVQLNKTTKKFSYTRRDTDKTDLTYSVWFSTDLSTWTQDTGAAEGTPTLNGEMETVEVTLSALPGDPLPAKLFIQVRAN